MEQLESLVIKARHGDLAAYGDIVRRFQDMAYGCGYAVLGDFHLAEDVAQEAFVEAYRTLGQLRQPAAFPGWFRRIVFKHCDRIARRKQVRTTALDAAAVTPTTELGPAEATEKREMQETVLAAIRALPEHQRMTTTLFYINGYSQKDIAEFLEVPVTTVKKRLHDARGRLKERMIDMVEKTLHDKAPDERFSQNVIKHLLAQPNLLEIEGHPVRQVWKDIRAALADYDIVSGSEIEDKETFSAAEDHAWDYAYRLDEQKSLRYQMTTVTMNAIRGREAPVRLLAAGRVFRPDKEDATHFKVFHQVDGVCIDAKADVESHKNTCGRALKAAVSQAEITWIEEDNTFVAPCLSAVVELAGEKYEVLGGGMLQAQTLQRAGYDVAAVKGFAWGMSLERLAMLKYGIDDIRKLWQSPYVPG